MPGTLEEAGTAISRAISICRDAEQGYRSAATSARDPELKAMLIRYSDLHGGFAAKLQEAVKALGYEPEVPAGLGGILYAGWVNLKALVTSHDQHGILVAAERGEDWVLSTYREAVDKTLPVGIRPLFEAQREEIQKAHDYLKQRRDATAPKPEPTPAPKAEPTPTAESTPKLLEPAPGPETK
jgi:uncharacterized protein (TIGR02284 family)